MGQMTMCCVKGQVVFSVLMHSFDEIVQNFTIVLCCIDMESHDMEAIENIKRVGTTDPWCQCNSYVPDNIKSVFGNILIRYNVYLITF